MISTMIIDDNINYIKYLLNTVISDINNIKVSYIMTDGQEALDIITKNNIDLILIDLKMQNFDGIEIIEQIKNMNLVTFPKIIVISGEVEWIYCMNNRGIVLDIIQKTESIKIIKNKIQNAINGIEYTKSLQKVKRKIVYELSSLGYNFKYKGTQYIYEAIIYVYQRNDMKLLDNLENNVYKYIAYKNNKTKINIKTNIIKATELAYISQDRAVIKKYFSIEIKPTPKVVISKILTKVNVDIV